MLSASSNHSNADNATKETNIAVVVRLRPRNSKEIKENSPICITAPNSKREVVVRPNPAIEATTKTYTFDKVFGPDVSQETVFKEVVSGMLEEVLLGYNCTIFAYGQTGTGKTYTMEGDLDNPYGTHSGIIPRTLFTMFDTLEREKTEYSVRVSFIELYNEELKDLLTPDDEIRKLRVFEDLSRKGSVVIQGLEEILVKNAADVISVLQRGSQKRQIASTKMNDASSRSHGIFSITVHIKETTPEGEELLKVGKLNLVDLAGSENIGRSGAENRRAKEAGMINQSLLTLGRVINALVERSPHIPYRESKLTRLLQDSLGGRTKTCIIAAISPAKCNIEESLSTLDYAHRAKNIRNKPEINQKMTKKALIREYVNEIERLKSDLNASREKNGIFLSPESYNSMVEEAQSKRDRIDELTKTLTARDEQIQTIQTERDQHKALVDITRQSLHQTQTELEDVKKRLWTALEELHVATHRIMEQQYLSESRKSSESTLHSVVHSLINKLDDNVARNDALHNKVETKNALEYLNCNEFSALKTNLLSRFQVITDISSQMKHALEESTANIRTVTTSMETFEAVACGFNSDWSSSNEIINASLQESASSVRDMQNLQLGLNEEIKGASEGHSQGLTNLVDELSSISLSNKDSLVSLFHRQQELLSHFEEEMSSELDQMTKLIQSAVESNKKELSGVRQAFEQQLTQKIETLERERNLYVQENQKLKTRLNSLKTEFITKLTQDLNEFDSEVSSGLDNINRIALESHERTIVFAKQISEAQGSLLQSQMAASDRLSSELFNQQSKCGRAVAQQIERMNPLIIQSEDVLKVGQDSVSQVTSCILQSASSHHANLDSVLNEHTTRMDQSAGRAKLAVEEVRKENEVLLQKANSRVGEFVSSVSASFDQINKVMDSYIATNVNQVNSVGSQSEEASGCLMSFELQRDNAPLEFDRTKPEYLSSDQVAPIRSDEELLSCFRQSFMRDGDSILTPSKRKDEESDSEKSSSGDMMDSILEVPAIAPAAEDDTKPFEQQPVECSAADSNPTSAVATKLPRIGRSLRSRSRPRTKE